MGMEYIYTDCWKMFDDINSRSETVICADSIEVDGLYIGYLLLRSEDFYKIKARFIFIIGF
jgi:hypothetical protein